MAMLPVLLNMVDDIYASLDNSAHGQLGGDIPLLFVPQSRGANCRQRCSGKRGCGLKQQNQQWKPTTEDFQVALNVKSFSPEEISVKVKGREVLVEGKHEEKKDDHGFVSRQFTRRYILPEPYDPDTIATYLDTEGKMTIKALKPKPAVEETQERIIPIERVQIEEKKSAEAPQNEQIEAKLD